MQGIELKRNDAVTMARQLYQALRTRMAEGSLKPGEALPSTRELAMQLGISRNTACEAYAMLLDEGFIRTSRGAATRVADGLVLDRQDAAEQPAIRRHKRAYAVDFGTGRPDLRCFPAYLWQQLLKKGADELPLEHLGYSCAEGLPALRQEIAQWLLRSRGLAESPQDIFVTAGSTQALHLLACLPVMKAKRIIVEDPCHIGMLGAWQAMGCEALPIPADGHGIQTGLLETADCADACAVYVTPSHQFPLGGILPAGRRAELIRFARDKGLYLIEDDYDSEFRYGGAPIAPLRSVDAARVVYVGTFSKTVFPALRVGFAVLPTALQEQWLHTRRHADVQNSPFEQAALAEFLRTRKFDRHVRQMRSLYGARRAALLRALGDAFGDECRVLGDAAGLHVAVQFPGMRFQRGFALQAREFGIRVTPMEYHTIYKGVHEDKLLLGFGHMQPQEIERGVGLLHEFMRDTFCQSSIV